MDSINSAFYFDVLKKQVLTVAGLEHVYAADCKALSILLFKRTNRHLSETTLKRIYGFARAKCGSSAFTKDVLAAFCGYQNWHHYQLEFLTRDHAETLETRQPASKQAVLPGHAGNLLKPFLDAMMVCIFLLRAVYDQDGEIIDFQIELANKAMEVATGRKDLSGKLYTQEYPGTKNAGLLDMMRKVMKTGQPERMEYHYPYDGLNAWYVSMLVKTPDGLWTAHYELSEQAHDISSSLDTNELHTENLLL